METEIDDEPRWQKEFPPSDASSEFFTLKLSPRSCRQLRQNLSTILTIFLRDLHKERMNRTNSWRASHQGHKRAQSTLISLLLFFITSPHISTPLEFIRLTQVNRISYHS
ncbi:hypothetical protein EYC84_003681 [Monilinia fructicola]|uniref:Uncharacterized protein n=1 Tax=Monilinia fructicola TaxID=38448 RepID=A0A5M9JZN6_MONFR|nr:hypothetical protein EYC84_003681 [Monilinia fructicola]